MSPTAQEVHKAATEAASGCLDHCLGVICHCVNQLSDEQIWWRPHPAMNSIGNLLLHLEGNIRQWILAGLTGGEDTRNRPAEFAATGEATRRELLERLTRTVEEARDVLANVSPESMLADRKVQGFSLDGWETVFDTVPHFKGHTQEIVCLTRQQLGVAYRFHWSPQSPAQGAPTQ